MKLQHIQKYDVMSETSKNKKYLMWYKVTELLSKKYRVSQISRMLGLHRQTVAKYRDMSEEEFIGSQSYERHYAHRLDPYERFVVDELRRWPFLSAPQIHDRLKENFSDLPAVTEKTVFNFVSRMRSVHDLPKEGEKRLRAYEKQPDTPYGEYAQADFGEKSMPTADGSQVKVYFFAMSLSRSRHKFLFFSRRPFTTSLAVYAHELAFMFYGGIPRRIVYDQDRVFLVDENLGDLILTAGFRSLVRECGFEPVFCRKGDPESKGKIENVVRYVKYNFLRGRVFTDIGTLNREAIGWLGRTGNGTMHHGTHKVPSEEFLREREHLRPYTGVPSPPVETMPPHHVRKDNVVCYHGNFYAVPTGTYRGRGTMVHLLEKDDTLSIYSAESGKTLAVHPIASGKGRLVSTTSLRRDREGALCDYERDLRAKLPADRVVDEYLAELRRRKPRNLRDNLQFIALKHVRYGDDTLEEAFRRCHAAALYNGRDLMDVAESIRKARKEPAIETSAIADLLPQADTAGMTPEKTDISTFNILFA